MVQDVSVFQNIDVEAELTAMLADDLAREINAQILSSLGHNLGENYHMGIDISS